MLFAVLTLTNFFDGYMKDNILYMYYFKIFRLTNDKDCILNFCHFLPFN